MSAGLLAGTENRIQKQCTDSFFFGLLCLGRAPVGAAAGIQCHGKLSVRTADRKISGESRCKNCTGFFFGAESGAVVSV